MKQWGFNFWRSYKNVNTRRKSGKESGKEKDSIHVRWAQTLALTGGTQSWNARDQRKMSEAMGTCEHCLQDRPVERVVRAHLTNGRHRYDFSELKCLRTSLRRRSRKQRANRRTGFARVDQNL